MRFLSVHSFLLISRYIPFFKFLNMTVLYRVKSTLVVVDMLKNNTQETQAAVVLAGEDFCCELFTCWVLVSMQLHYVIFNICDAGSGVKCFFSR